jgi:hypothetical protein
MTGRKATETIHAVELSSCWNSGREEASDQHDHVRCVPNWRFPLTFAQVTAFAPEVCKTVG